MQTLLIILEKMWWLGYMKNRIIISEFYSTFNIHI